MNITFAPSGILQIDDARIIFRNFSGAPSKYNRQGDRNFAVVIPNEELANELINRGWNVKIRPPREDGDTPFMYLQVKIKFNERGPKVFLISGKSRTELTEEMVGCVDDIDIDKVDLDIRPYDWTVQEGRPDEKRGRTAYLQDMEVVQKVNRFEQRYAEQMSPPEDY